MIKGHGSDIHNFKLIKADFSSNVSYVDYSKVIKRILLDNIPNLKHYPDVEYRELSSQIALYHNCDRNNILVSNGAVAAIYQLAQTFSEYKSSLFYPEFSEYESACKMHNHQIEFLSIGDFKSISSNCQFAIIGNPNNPTGQCFAQDKLLALVSQRKDVIFAIDEAYMDFVSHPQSLAGYINKYPNLIIINSFTKRFSIPGLRLGYLLANPQLINRINRFSQPWSVNSLAAHLGKIILKKQLLFPMDFPTLYAEKERLYRALSLFEVLEIRPSHSNYFLIKMLQKTAIELKTYLAEQHHILIRDASNFRGLTAQYFRISVRNKTDNQLLLSALTQFFKA